MTWDANDVPPQRAENDGVAVTYEADGNGKIHEVRLGLSREDMARANDAARCVPRFGVSPDVVTISGAMPRLDEDKERQYFAEMFGGGGARPWASLSGSPSQDVLAVPSVGGVRVEGSYDSLPAGEPQYVAVAGTMPAQRRYLPTLAELIDRMSIVQLKAIFILDNRAEYEREIEDIIHDIDLILSEKQQQLGAEDIRAIQVIMLANRYIWENEGRARAAAGNDQDKLLKLTHSVNGVRNTAKNVLSRSMGDRVDLKVDCFAAELVEEFGNWQIFDATGAA